MQLGRRNKYYCKINWAFIQIRVSTKNDILSNKILFVKYIISFILKHWQIFDKGNFLFHVSKISSKNCWNKVFDFFVSYNVLLHEISLPKQMKISLEIRENVEEIFRRHDANFYFYFIFFSEPVLELSYLRIYFLFRRNASFI